jgi:hypothetical protein
MVPASAGRVEGGPHAQGHHPRRSSDTGHSHLLPAMPVDAEWWAPATPIAAAVPIPLELMQQAADLPVLEIVDYSTVGDHSAGQ